MARAPALIALVFDFDDTLAPDSTSKLLRDHGIDPDDFWRNDARALVEQGYDPALAYLKLLLDRVGEGRELGLLTRGALRDFGGTLDDTFFDGLPDLFDDLQRDVQDNFNDISIEFYIISGGLEDVLLGSSVVRSYFREVYGCRLVGDDDDDVVRYIQRCVTFTEKDALLVRN